jgi:geranylgeranylglycerol-phosphate geranylgeranyltransferase
MRARLAAHFEAARPDLLTYAGLVSLAGALLASVGNGTDPPLWRLVGAWLAPTLGWLAAMYGGDYFDRHLDAVAKPHRPIPSGRMSAGAALAGLVVNVLLGGIVAVLLNPYNAIVVVVTLGLGIAYSRYLKARGIWGNLIRGGVTAMAFVMGTLATSPTLSLQLMPIALMFWLHDSGSNVIGTICDREGDRKGGYHTIPVRHGDAAALRLLVLLDVLWLALAVAGPLAIGARLDLAAYSAFLAVATVMGLATIVLLIRAPRPIPRMRALQAHEVLVVERLVLAAGLVAAAGSVGFALALLIPSATATIAASLTMMRQRYEPTRPVWRTRPAGDHP